MTVFKHDLQLLLCHLPEKMNVGEGKQSNIPKWGVDLKMEDVNIFDHTLNSCVDIFSLEFLMFPKKITKNRWQMGGFKGCQICTERWSDHWQRRWWAGRALFLPTIFFFHDWFSFGAFSFGSQLVSFFLCKLLAGWQDKGWRGNRSDSPIWSRSKIWPFSS